MSSNDIDIRRELKERAELLASLPVGVERGIRRVADAIVSCVQKGGTVFACGNGGSASQAQHFAAELVGRFKRDRPGLPAYALTENVATLTAVANDYGYGEVFSRQIAALARSGDCLLALSTSGNSENVVRACREARKMGVSVFALTGDGPSQLASQSDITIRVPHADTARIQEMHLVVIHLICQLVESTAFSSPPARPR